MSGRWRKLGRLYAPGTQGRHPKLHSHAANPLPVHLEGDVYRVFYSGRDAHKRSSIGAVDIDLLRREIVQDHHAPAFEHGPEGSFHADGVSIGNCYSLGDTRYMLFMGWQVAGLPHWRGEIGRLVVGQDLALRLDSGHPFLAIDRADPVSLSYPWVQPHPAGGYLMWYGSTHTWDAGNGEMLHPIHVARSADGHHWEREGPCIPFEAGVAQAFSRPTVARARDGSLEMWFSYRSGRGETYRIGRAVGSDDGPWRLALNEGALDVSPGEWDGEMVEYPFVWEHRGQQYMLYNGNGYGATGFGLAVREAGAGTP
jgi:hypothetical protein